MTRVPHADALLAKVLIGKSNDVAAIYHISPCKSPFEKIHLRITPSPSRGFMDNNSPPRITRQQKAAAMRLTHGDAILLRSSGVRGCEQ